MTKAVERNNSHKDDNFSGISSHLRDENDAIGEQLGSHVHLTNCIHLRNHIHLHSPNMTERSLIRDLIVLQQSRSLRDPSTSPPSWISPSIVGSFAKRTVNDCSVHTERRSVGIDRRNEVSQLSASSTAVGSTAKSKSPTIEDVMRNYDIGQRGRAADKSRNEEANAKCPEVVMPESKIQYKDSSGSLHGKEKKLGKSVHVQAARLRTLSEQLEEVTNQLDYGCKKPSPLSHHDRPVGEPHQWPKENINENFNGKNRTKKCRVKNARRSRGSIDLRGTHTRRSLAAASDLMAQVSDVQDYTGNCQENTEVDAAWAPINVCGIPWNWSRIHHRGKTYLDKAGRSFSCSMSESGPRETEVPIPQREDNTLSMGPGVSNKLTPSTSSDSEVLPLLNEASGSRESDVNHFLSWDYSGEFGVFTNRSLMDGIDSDHVSDERSHNHRKYRGCDHGRHRSLTQKYMPKTFKDLVGQNLVVQALTNAVSRNIVGLIYIFYGPHGTGKTSCARVFTKALNCQSAEHLRPCDICNSCISHNLGRSKDVIEVGPVGKFDFERIIDAFENLISPPRSSQYKVFIIDDCDTLPQNLWGPISKVIDKAPRHVIFVLISSNLDHFPHIILSRCQKFFFPKLKDSDILRTLQWISTSEGLEIDRDALKLIASRSDGSLRDAEMTLDQLCLLGQGVSLSLVQELVGLVSDEKLVDLLDLALSADTVNTVKSLREIMETGVEPLALMSQIATVITDILAGSYVFTQERLRRKFFRRITLSKAEMEKLRQALKTLSHAEKQLRVSNDKLTWLTAALLQLAPDQQYVLPNSSTDRSFSHSPIILSNNARGVPKSPTSEQDDMHIDNKELPGGFGVGIRNSKSRNYALNSVPMGQQLANSHIVNKGYCEHVPHKLVLSKETVTKSEGYNDERSQKNIGKIWQAVLENIQSDALRQFLYSEGKLHSINLGAAPTARLVFSSNANKSRAENFRVQILQAFESVIGSATILEIRSESRTNFGNGVHASPVLPASENITFMMTKQQSISGKGFIHSDSQNLQRSGRRDARLLYSVPHIITEGEIIEMGTSREEYKQMDPTNKNITPMEKVLESAWTAETSSSQHQHKTFPFSERKDGDNQHQRKSLIRGKISLAHVIQQAESCSKLSGWSRLKAISITEKLERENLRLEPRSRSLLCWKASKRTRTKLSSLRIGSRKPRALMKLVACGRCLYVRSPR